MTRRRISDRTLLASCLARLFEVPHAHQQAMHEDQMISLAERDHFPIPVAEGGSDHFSNVWARMIGEHREKTRKVDVPGIAKRKRLARAETEHAAHFVGKVRLTSEPAAAYDPTLPRRKRSIPTRGFAKAHRPIRSRNNLRRRQP